MVRLGHTRSRTGLQAGAHCVPTLKSNRSIPTQVIHSLNGVKSAAPAMCTGCSTRQNACGCSWRPLQPDESLHALPCGCCTVVRLRSLYKGAERLASCRTQFARGSYRHKARRMPRGAQDLPHKSACAQPAFTTTRAWCARIKSYSVHVASQTVEHRPGSHRQSAVQ